MAVAGCTREQVRGSPVRLDRIKVGQLLPNPSPEIAAVEIRHLVHLLEGVVRDVKAVVDVEPAECVRHEV